MRSCSVEKCERKYNCKGYCHLHYTRWKKHGDPLVNLKPKNHLCSISGCNKTHEAKGYCPMHYDRLRRLGDARFVTPTEMTAKQKILSNIKKNTNCCWEWTGALEKFGYAQLSFKGRIIKAHRLSYIAFIGEIPKGLLICHKCDNPSCVNPDHLFLGSHKDNYDDMVNKNRDNFPKADFHYKSLLSRREVKEIKKFPLELNNVQIGKIYNVDRRVISNIRNNKTYKSVDSL